MTPRNGGGRFTRKAAKPDTFGEPDRAAGIVSVDVGRGQAVEVKVGADFVNTLEQIARDYHYGGYYRIFLAEGSGRDMHEVVNPEDSPDKVEAGMRIAITSYDKVGRQSLS